MLCIMNEPSYQEDEMKYPAGSNAPTVAAKTPLSGGVLISLVAILCILLFGLYYWFAVLQTNQTNVAPVPSRPTASENNEPESTTAEVQVETLEVVSTSNEIDAIEADIEATNLDELDAELTAIDAELEAAIEAE